ncbi:MAG TPA: lysylphosphatidylglycerol synthase transmembrane domain-containing protein, partial [Chloroflexia bacterium]|nr:lysylphosphatidylglycerol synthase transmembrane domain-containing protein [Chloroflexia bacterium]
MNKRLVFLLIGIVISVVSLYFAFKDFDLGQVWDAIGRVRLEFFLLLIVPYVGTFMTKVWRWRVMFHPDEQRVSHSLLFSALMISYIPLPFRAGEVARGVVASTRSGIPAPRVFSTIVVEKVLDILTLLLFLGISLPFVGLPRELQGPAILLGGVVLVMTLVILALVLKPSLARKVIHAVAARLPARLGPRIETAGDQVLQGLAPLSNPPIALRLGLWSLATWGVNIVTVYLMMLAFNLTVTPMAAAVLVVVTNLSMAIPSAPGYVGPFEFAVVSVLGLLNVPTVQAQTFALIYHFVGLVPVALLGVIAAIQQGVSMAAFRGVEADGGQGSGVGGREVVDNSTSARIPHS